MRTRTLAQLRDDVRARADMRNSTFITDADINEYINQSIAVLYGKLVGVKGQDYFEKSSSFTTTQGATLYNLPSDFWQLISVEIQDGTFKRVMQPFMRKERARWSEYQVPAGYPITVFYVPNAVRLANDSDVFDGYNGWEEWVILDAAIKCMSKEESDPSELKVEKAQIENEITGLAPERDAGWPERIVDVGRYNSTNVLTGGFSFSGGVPRYRLRGTAGIDGTGQQIEVLWGPIPGGWFEF